MSTSMQDTTRRDISEKAYGLWASARWHLGRAIDKAVTFPAYRLTGWIAEGRASTIDEDCDAMYRMGFAMGEQRFLAPTRQQVTEAHAYLTELGIIGEGATA